VCGAGRRDLFDLIYRFEKVSAKMTEVNQAIAPS
jgi:hypothetical protein